MRVWLIGAGNIGTVVLRQLQKNLEVDIFISDPSDRPEAVRSGLIDAVDLVANITPVNINEIARRVRPDLLLLSPGIGEQGFGAVEGSKALSDALNYEITIASEYPCLILSLSNHT